MDRRGEFNLRKIRLTAAFSIAFDKNLKRKLLNNPEIAVLSIWERITYKLHRVRYLSFYRYFHYLKQLGFIEPTGREDASYMQKSYPDAPPRRYYRLSVKGQEAPEWE